MTLDRFRWTLSTPKFIALAAAFNALLYHLPLFSFSAGNLEILSFSGLLTLVTVMIALLSLTAVLLAILSLISYRFLKPFCMLVAISNSIAVYFVATYHVVLDKTMMGNLQNTNFAESFEFLHPTIIVYVLIFGVLPCWLLSRVCIEKPSRGRLAAMALTVLVFTVIWTWLASGTWGWIDKNSKKLGGMVMPWSYLINAARYEVPRLWTSDVQILLPAATFSFNEKTIVILIVGEAARAQNFQLYGYNRPTNPLLAKAGVTALKHSMACSTYTTASLRCILSHVDSSSEFSTRYEPLPSYLHRNGIDVIWRSRNSGEPSVKVQTYQRAGDLMVDNPSANGDYDEVLLAGLEQRIRSSPSQKVFVVLHQGGSHGPAYSTKYPGNFEFFKPVCRSVELGKCRPEELINAYDNTILYTDYCVSQTIGLLKKFQNTSTLLIYVSDHGESLGEYGLYLHGTPWSIAPDVQKVVPFLVWMSDEFIHQRGVELGRLEAQSSHSQRDIFHTVMGAFSMHSDAYQADYDIFSQSFSSK